MMKTAYAKVFAMQDVPWRFFLRRISSVGSMSWSCLRQYPLSSLVAFMLLLTVSSFSRSFAEFNTHLQINSLSLDSFSNQYIESNDSVIFDKMVQPVSRKSIPRIIHRTYKTTEIPPEWQEAYDSCRILNPTYEEYFWTDESARRFIQTQYPWFLRTYDSYPYMIQRVDALRYFLLWHYGGIYIDLDIGCRQPLDPLLDFSAVFPKTWPYGVSNDFMGSVPGHPFIVKVALSLSDHNRYYVSKYITVFFTTGPMFLSNVLSGWLAGVGDSAEDVVGSHRIAILPSMMYDTTDHSFLAHYIGSSWHGNDVAVIRFMYTHLWALLLVSFGLIVLGGAMFQVQMCRRPTQAVPKRYEEC